MCIPIQTPWSMCFMRQGYVIFYLYLHYFIKKIHHFITAPVISSTMYILYIRYRHPEYIYIYIYIHAYIWGLHCIYLCELQKGTISSMSLALSSSSWASITFTCWSTSLPLAGWGTCEKTLWLLGTRKPSEKSC